MFRSRKSLSVVLSAALTSTLTLALLAIQPGAALAVGASAPKQPSIPYEKFTLRNGLQVILSEDHRLPLVAVDLWYHVGPANELPGRTGFAHLFEHMMFEGSKHVGAHQHFRYLEAAGASEDTLNGTTEFDRTNYFETLPSNQLELALWLESDRMGSLLETLDRRKLATQRDVVRNERRSAVENEPYGLVKEAEFHELFPQGHPYHANVIGSHADIEAARLHDVRDFFKHYYGPNNASLAIVGDIDRSRTKIMVEKYFGSIPSGPAVAKPDLKTPPVQSIKRTTVTDQIERPCVYIAWLTPPIYQAGNAEAELAARVLGGGRTSRLYQKLVNEKQIAQDVQVSNRSLMLGSVFSIEVIAKAGIEPGELESSIEQELANFRKDGPSQTEVETARNCQQMQITSALEGLGGYGGVADRLNQYNYFLGDPGYLSRDLERYDQVTTSSLKDFANRYLTERACVVVYGVRGKREVQDVPRTGEEDDELASSSSSSMPSSSTPSSSTPSSSTPASSTPASSPVSGFLGETWRAEPPKASPESLIHLPAPIKFFSSNGLTVYLFEQHRLPIVAARLVALGGNSANPIDKPGLSRFTTAMMREGTKSRTSLELANALAHDGITLDTGSESDAAWISLLNMANKSDNAFGLLSDIILHPAFETEEIEKKRKEIASRLELDREQSYKIASRAVYRILFGAQNPLGYDEKGTNASVRSISRDDLLRFWQGEFVPGNSALIIAGDLSQDEAKKLVEKHLGNWQGKPPPSKPKSTFVSNAPALFVVNKEGASQTAVDVGTLGLSRSNHDYVAASLANTILGGLYSSRLNLNLRERHGYAYCAFSHFHFWKRSGVFIAESRIRTDATAPAIGEIYQEIKELCSQPLDANELSMAKDNMVLSLPGMFETSEQATKSLSDLFTYDLPDDYYLKLAEEIKKTTPEARSQEIFKS
jgi:zinc protease